MGRAAPARAVLVLAVMALAGHACGPGPRPTTDPGGLIVAFEATESSGRLVVRLADHTGLAWSMTPGPLAAATGEGHWAALNPDDSPSALLVWWVGGACDTEVRLSLDAIDSGYGLTIRSTTSGLGCTAVGILRIVRIDLSQPVDAASVTVNGG
jgi:hypothetical protein